MITNSAHRIPAATSWHSSNDPNWNPGSCVTRVGTATRGRRSVMSMPAVAAFKAEKAAGDVVDRKNSVAVRAKSASLNPEPTLWRMFANSFHSRSPLAWAEKAARRAGSRR